MFKPEKLLLLKKFASDNSIATIKYNGQGFNPLYRDDEVKFLHAEQPVMFTWSTHFSHSISCALGHTGQYQV